MDYEYYKSDLGKMSRFNLYFNNKPLEYKLSILKRFFKRRNLTTNLITLIEIAEQMFANRVDIKVNFGASYKEVVIESTYFSAEYSELAGGYTNYTYTYLKYDYEDLQLNNCDLIIHFPELTISNSSKASYTIYDLFVDINLSVTSRGKINKNYNYIIGSISGIRMSRNIVELTTGYIHSHLTTKKLTDNKSFTKYTNFCLGQGELAITISTYNYDTNNTDSLEMFYTMLVSYLQWESIEGGPHIRILDNDLRDFKYEDININTAQDRYLFLIRALQTNADLRINWHFNTDDNKYEVIDNEIFEDFLLMNLKGTLLKSIQGEYCKKSEDIPTIDIDLSSQNIIFNGKKIEFKIIDEIPQPVNNKLYVHPKIKKYVKRKLESIANYTQLKKVAARR